MDAFADIAVLGPIDAGTSAITLQPVGDIDEVGDGDVFLVGYPGEGPEDPHVALARGLLSRMRDDTTFDVTYVQTDAAIGGGQSGGALVDGEGRLLGISSASFAEAFALAVVTDDVLASFERIIDGDGDETNVIPDIDDAPDEPRSVDLTEAASTQLVVIPADDDDREITLDVGTSDDVAITVGNYVGDVFAWNDAARDLGEEFADDGGFTFDTSDGFDPFEGTDDLEETSPGTYVFSAPADQDLIVSLGRVDDVALLVEVNVPFDVLPVGIEGAQVEIGSSTRGVLDGFALSAIHTIELREGDEIEISLHAGTSDPYFTLVAPGEIYDDFSDPSGDDGGGGLYDLDADETFTIDESGTWQIVVSTYEALVAGYQLDVTRAG